MRPRIAVIGAGIAGLAAAHELALDGRVEVVIVEGSSRTGGKLLRGEVPELRMYPSSASLRAGAPV